MELFGTPRFEPELPVVALRLEPPVLPAPLARFDGAPRPIDAAGKLAPRRWGNDAPPPTEPRDPDVCPGSRTELRVWDAASVTDPAIDDNTVIATVNNTVHKTAKERLPRNALPSPIVRWERSPSPRAQHDRTASADLRPRSVLLGVLRRFLRRIHAPEKGSVHAGLIAPRDQPQPTGVARLADHAPPTT